MFTIQACTYGNAGGEMLEDIRSKVAEHEKTTLLEWRTINTSRDPDCPACGKKE